ncbi:hypothetical protein AGMMS50284_7880 [Clostridia bacterium]|nr:hypothetical protein AGMMS50284_7880 [Clostridia bacterium]
MESSGEVFLLSLYPGDNYSIEGDNPAVHPTVTSYEKFTHTWAITNSGTVPWNGRFLELINQKGIAPTAEPSRVDIPPTKPRESAPVTVSFDARAMDGSYESIWRMKDSQERPCVPNKEGLRLIINVSFKLYLERQKAASEAAIQKTEV